MRVQYRKRNDNNWKEIPNVDFPIAISDVMDDTFDALNITFLISENDVNFNELRNLKPKTYIRISDTEEDDEINDLNTFHFITTQLPKSKIRNKVVDENDNVITPELWEVSLKGLELIKETEDYKMPNYTITQPKTQYFNRYTRIVEDRYVFNQKYDYSTNTIVNLVSTSKTSMQENNEGGIITTTNTMGELRVRLNNVSTETYRIKLDMFWQKTANSKYGIYNIYSRTSGSLGERPTPDTRIIYVTYYFDTFDNLIPSLTKSGVFDLEYEGGNVTTTSNGRTITSLASPRNAVITFTVPKGTSASYSIVYINLVRRGVFKNYSNVDVVNTGFLQEMNTNISGFDNNSYVKAQIQTIALSINSNELTSEIETKKVKLVEFVEKALFDYNLNRRNKLTLSDDAKYLLDVFAKESEWDGYNFRELLVRAFSYVNAVPFLKEDGTITAIKPSIIDQFIEVNDETFLDESIIDDDYYDTVVSSAKNVVSDTDFTIETALIGSGSDEFSMVSEDNATFRFTNQIYYVSRAIVDTKNIQFNLPLKAGGTVNVKTNMGEDYKWDITKRLFDNDIYKSFPNVNFTSALGRTSGELSQANTISFKSGSRNVENVTHRGDTIPNFSVLSINSATVTQYAIIEALICLAYEYVLANTSYLPSDFADNYNPGIEFKDIINFELNLVYVPYHKELTTKYVSNKLDRGGLHYQKLVSISDRTIDFKENELVLTKEMNKKGNTTFIVNKHYNYVQEVIPAGSIINGGKYVVTSARILIFKDFVECEYTLDTEILNKNTDVGLSVEYTPYSVPYEYVLREIMLDNHLIFTDTTTNQFASDIKSCTTDFLRDIFTPNDANGYNTDEEIYAILGMQYNGMPSDEVFIKLNKLTSRFTMVLNGSFIDNYNAGNQRYFVDLGAGDYNVYSQPYSYTDYQGQVKAFNSVKIGYRPLAKYRIHNSYDLNLFPDVPSYETINRLYLNITTNVANEKDSREAISLNYHTYLETLTEKIKFYGFNKINAFGTLSRNVELTDELTINDLPIGFYTDIPISTTFTDIANNGVRISFSMPTADILSNGINFSNGIVLLNKEGKSINLVGIVKNPTVVTDPIATTINIYVYPTRYGKK